MQCHHCGQEHPAGTRFCPSTGLAINAPRKCPSCGKPIETEWKTCAYCGQSLIATNLGGARSSLWGGDKSWKPKRVAVFGVIVLLIMVVVIFSVILFGGSEEEQTGANRPTGGLTPGVATESQTPEASTLLPGNAVQGESTLAASPPANTAFVGTWEIAVSDSMTVPDYKGELPAQGHKFHQIRLLIVNRGSEPSYFSGFIGTFYAEQGDYQYYGKDLSAPKGYIPPGWPLLASVTFDLPTNVDAPAFYLVPSSGVNARNPILLDSLSTSISSSHPSVRKLNEEFKVLDQYHRQLGGRNWFKSGMNHAQTGNLLENLSQ